MNLQGLAELRKRLNPDRRNPSLIRGCYCGPDGSVISVFSQDVYGLTEEDNEKFMGIFKKVLSGTFGQNLLDVEFPASMIPDSEEFRMMMTLKDSHLKDDEAVGSLLQRILALIPAISNVNTQSVKDMQEAQHYLILLMTDTYDVPYKDGNGETDADRGNEVFDYVLCSICPVKQTKTALTYLSGEQRFHTADPVWTVGTPELGFLYPAFEERGTDLYHALCYGRTNGDGQTELISRVFGVEPNMQAKDQNESFSRVLEEALGEECSLNVIQTMHETVSQRLEEQKADKHADMLCLTKNDVREVLTDCGVSEEKAEAFEQKYTETFGAYTELPAVNLVTPKKFNVNTANVSIKVDPEHSDLIETRMIDGKMYILVPADGDIEVNGVRVMN